MRVDPVVQRERDDTRKTILEDELASEARQLADAQAELRGAKALSASAGSVEEMLSAWRVTAGTSRSWGVKSGR